VNQTLHLIDVLSNESRKTGIKLSTLLTIAIVESGGDPRSQTGKYKGLFMLSDEEFKKHGDPEFASIFDMEANADAAGALFVDLAYHFHSKMERWPLPHELYLMHQQGVGGSMQHFRFPRLLAWQNMRGTAEGRRKGDEWCKKAVWGNMTPEMRKGKSIETLTSEQFVYGWYKHMEKIVRERIS